MCPSYMATNEELHSTRGRAHLLWELMQEEVLPNKWQNEQVRDAHDLCLSCKACKSECPVSVDMATYKAEFLAHHYEGKSRPLFHYAFGRIDRWAKLASYAPGLVNAVKNGAPQVWPDKPGNVLFDVSIGDKAATEAAFAKAHTVAEISIVNPRVVASFMETRAAVCEYDAKADHLTLTVGSQGSHRLRDILCQNILKIPVEKMRVICPDVGGGFGTKLFPYREYALLAVAARKLKKTVRWTAERSEHFMGDEQGRDTR